jgi:hypothetical protein
MYSRILWAVILALPAAGAILGEEKADTWQAAVAIYQKRTTELESECEPKVRSALDQYAKALGELETTLADKKEQAAVHREKTRVESEQRLSDSPPANLPPAAEELRTACRKALAAAQDEKCRRVTELTRLYIDHLTGIQKKLTTENKVEEAIKVRDEIKKATFLMADAQSKIEPPAATPETPTTPAVSKICSRCNGQKVLVEECPLCKGSGDCPSCGGTGRDPSRPTLRHTLCRGNGKCPKCMGNGKLKTPCPVCTSL